MEYCIRVLGAIVFVLFSCFSIESSAQMGMFSGRVQDSGGQTLPGAGVALLSSLDSSLVATSITDSTGNFRLSLSPGNYILKISYISFADYFQSVKMTDVANSAGTITLQNSSKSLKAVDVDAQTLQAQQKGDTTQYNADAFKINKDANAEDLVTKMPGITQQDGKVQAQGEEVKKVLIDGKPFLGDDPNAALKSLPAEVIDKIQVFDRKSDQSAFTGFDDGNTTKTLNIITRPQFRNGTFGKIYSGYGTDELWKNGMNVNFFKDKRKLTILGSANNVNEQNFSTDDLLGIIGTSQGNRSGGMRGGGYRSGGGGSGSGRYMQQNDAGNFLIDTKSGIAKTYAAGLNYTNQWKKLGFTGSYFFNRTENNSNSSLKRQYFSDASNLVYDETGISRNTNINHRGNISFDYKFDSLNSVLLQPRISYQDNNGESINNGSNNDVTGQLSQARNATQSDLKAYNFSAPLLYRKSFIKKGRTFSANLNPGFTRNDGNSSLFSYTTYFTDTLTSDTLNQISELVSDGFSLTSEIVYTEPLDTNSQLSFTYKNYYSNGKSDKRTYAYSHTYEIYEGIDSTLSNTFESKYFSQSGGISYRYQKEAWNMMIGTSYQEATLDNEQDFPSSSIVQRTFRSILPSAMFQYKFTQKKNLRLFYRSSNNSPTVNQLQEVINNNNPLQLSTGNPDLKQDWQNNINIRYSAINSEKNTSFFIFANASFTKDYIGNSTYISTNDTITVMGITLSNGAQFTMPVNLSGQYSYRFFGNYSFPIKKIKSNFNINGNAGYSHSPSLLNGSINFSNSLNTGLGFSLSSNVSDKFDFTFSSNGGYNTIRNTLRENLNNNYYNLNSRFRTQIQPWKGLVFATDLNHQYNAGLSSSYNQSYLIWNGSIGYKFLKNKTAELRFSVNDILEKNTNITRNTTDTYYEDVQSNQLRRFFMLTFTYNLKFFKMTKKEE